jgi:hypothetical protein
VAQNYRHGRQFVRLGIVQAARSILYVFPRHRAETQQSITEPRL